MIFVMIIAKIFTAQCHSEIWATVSQSPNEEQLDIQWEIVSFRRVFNEEL